MSKIGKLGHRKYKQLAQGHTTDKWLSQDSNPDRPEGEY